MDAQKLAIDIINKRPIYWHDLKYLPWPLWKIDPRLGLEFKLGRVSFRNGGQFSSEVIVLNPRPPPPPPHPPMWWQSFDGQTEEIAEL